MFRPVGDLTQISCGSNINERHRIEEAFHDVQARSRKPNFYDFGALDIPDAHLFSTLGDLKCRSLLEIGCGTGINTVAFAKAGAHVTALDISNEMVRATIARARAEGVADQVRALHIGAEDVNFPDNSFDIVFGHSVLHHLDLRAAMPRIAGALRGGGIASFLDPLDHNPFLNIMRALTPNIRTATEKPLSLKQIDDIASLFSSSNHREFHFLSLAAFFWFYGIKSESLFRSWILKLSRLDNVAFKLFPYLRRFSWVTVLTFIK